MCVCVRTRLLANYACPRWAFWGKEQDDGPFQFRFPPLVCLFCLFVYFSPEFFLFLWSFFYAMKLKKREREKRWWSEMESITTGARFIWALSITMRLGVVTRDRTEMCYTCVPTIPICESGLCPPPLLSSSFSPSSRSRYTYFSPVFFLPLNPRLISDSFVVVPPYRAVNPTSSHNVNVSLIVLVAGRPSARNLFWKILFSISFDSSNRSYIYI